MISLGLVQEWIQSELNNVVRNPGKACLCGHREDTDDECLKALVHIGVFGKNAIGLRECYLIDIRAVAWTYHGRPLIRLQGLSHR